MRQAKMGQGIRGVHAATETALGHVGPHHGNSKMSPELGSRGLLLTWLGFLVVSATSQVAP